uniref:GG17459 n=2 Tax=Drosophila erecta TaxID=7220 RepID=B3NZU4_DROER
MPTQGRKIKRKEPNYHHHVNVPPPPPPPAPHAPGPVPQQTAVIEHEVPPYAYEAINHDEFEPAKVKLPYFEGSADYVVHSHSGGGGYLADNGLRSIAKGSADQALSAVASQNAAGKQASYVAKSTLAQAAAQAAGTAVAVLKGKEVLLHRLEDQSVEAHKSMENELTQLQQAKRSAKAAQYAAQQAINHVSVLTAALNNAQSASELAQKAASEAAAELASQIDMVAQAKTKLEHAESQAYAARLDYEETRDAAEKATLSAQEAHLNANDAALHANVELAENVHIHDKSDRHVREPPRNHRHQ